MRTQCIEHVPSQRDRIRGSGFDRLLTTLVKATAKQRSCRRDLKPCEFGRPIGGPQEHLREGEEVRSGKVSLKCSGRFPVLEELEHQRVFDIDCVSIFNTAWLGTAGSCNH